MITCPWCGTNYLEFQSNCRNCGGIIPLPQEQESEAAPLPPTPPPPPRPVSEAYAKRLLLSDAWAVASFVFALLGLIFTVLGITMTIAIITAFVGIPFALIGIVFLAGGAGLLAWRYQEKRKVVEVLRHGAAVNGSILSVEQNYTVRVNHRHPWVVRYQFHAAGRAWEGQVSTFNALDPSLKPGARVCVLHLPADPQWNVLYPHP